MKEKHNIFEKAMKFADDASKSAFNYPKSVGKEESCRHERLECGTPNCWQDEHTCKLCRKIYKTMEPNRKEESNSLRTNCLRQRTRSWGEEFDAFGLYDSNGNAPQAWPSLAKKLKSFIQSVEDAATARTLNILKEKIEEEMNNVNNLDGEEQYRFGKALLDYLSEIEGK